FAGMEVSSGTIGDLASMLSLPEKVRELQRRNPAGFDAVGSALQADQIFDEAPGPQSAAVSRREAPVHQDAHVAGGGLSSIVEKTMQRLQDVIAAPQAARRARKVRTVRVSGYEGGVAKVARVSLVCAALVFAALSVPMIARVVSTSQPLIPSAEAEQQAAEQAAETGTMSRLSDAAAGLAETVRTTANAVPLEAVALDRAATAEALSETAEQAGYLVEGVQDKASELYGDARPHLLDGVGAVLAATEAAAAAVVDSESAPEFVADALGGAATGARETRETLAVNRLLNSLPTDPEGRRAAIAAKIGPLMETADQAYEAEQYTRPIGDSAYDGYLDVLRLDPYHSGALAGLERITKHYEERAAVALNRRRFDEFHTLNALIDRVRMRQPAWNQ
ncbi:MAG: hypothetical protein AAFV62_14260, partial [Pseudomonadota bacterium]